MRKFFLFLSTFIACAPLAFSQALPSIVWPGQSGNTVGYTAAPNWPGSFTATACPASPASGTSWANAVVVKNCTYNTGFQTTVTCNYCEFLYVDFNGGSNASIQAAGDDELFMGDRFQSNDENGSNIGAVGHYIYFFYNSVVPLVSLHTSPPGYTWPSAGAGQNTTNPIVGTYAIAQADGYGYGFNLGNGSYGPGPIWIDHNDVWGYADAMVLQTLNNVTITGNQFHDPRNPGSAGAGQDHTDGVGYTNDGVAPNNVTMIGNTSAMIGNTQNLALQGATGGYNEMYIADNYFTGVATVVGWCSSTGSGYINCTNSYFYGNVNASDIQSGGQMYGYSQTVLGSGTQWDCNRIHFVPGTTWQDGNDNWAPTSAMDGQYFVIPSGTVPNVAYNSATDLSYGFSTNAYCGIPSPSTINFGMQGSGSSSVGQTITLYSNNTGSLSISSIALASGTQFSITSNTCGSTLNSGSSCVITVKFAPTAMGPQTDTLQITDNTPGATSPQLVSLTGFATAANASIPPSPANPMLLEYDAPHAYWPAFMEALR